MPVVETRGALDVPLVGGWLCLDFANTRGSWGGDQQYDFVTTYRELLDWSKRVTIVSPDTYGHLRSVVTANPAIADVAFSRANGLRDCLYGIFSEIAHDAGPNVDDLRHLETWYQEATAHAHLLIEDRTARWDWGEASDHPEPDLNLPAWQVAMSAIDLLRSDRLARLKHCEGAGEGPCGWLFIDESRAGNRRWCSSAECGTVYKWRRQNARRAGRRVPAS